MKIKIVNKGEEAALLLSGRIDSNVAKEMEKSMLDVAG